MVQKCDAVFEGGGVKGIAFVGAIQETEKRGYQFARLAGTSAGAITASLLAAGYTGSELEEIMEEFSFLHFLETDWVGRIPILGKGMNIYWRNGMYTNTRMELWMKEKLNKKGVDSFGDLPEGKLKIIASDISNGRIMIIPDDLEWYGVDWKSFSIAKAVQMSTTIPYFFRPVEFSFKKDKIYIIDGAILSNYPVWIFDTPSTPRWPTFGYRLRAGEVYSPSLIKGPISLFIALFTTMLEAHDRRSIEGHDAVRTIFIPVEGVKTTDFRISTEQKKRLIELGRREAKDFFEQWNYSAYLVKHRLTPKVNQSCFVKR
ncbi:patatin-like phospholipase family protein [Caldalkalibacillus mannanilyticus]|uniref:patatin-like phospholipase family protein n=1 Tax=Caldalkalibacillus mannanilyticus TaxID=1418 RepID=UPI0004691C2F|nr:patatin-like phospholipase family protein [Caldalkalibacillus mannanilyticus]